MLTTEQSTEKSVTTLNSLLRGEISACETYSQALEKLRNLEARDVLEECLQSHERRVERLRQQILLLGGQPSKGSGPWGAFTKLFEGGAKALGPAAAIAALEEGEDHGLKEYRQSLNDLDASSRQVVEIDLLPAQVRSHQSLSTLKHNLEEVGGDLR